MNTLKVINSETAEQYNTLKKQYDGLYIEHTRTSDKLVHLELDIERRESEKKQLESRISDQDMKMSHLINDNVPLKYLSKIGNTSTATR
jgi:predicted  nucleic acid-binding Zn-ribbon protein